MKPYKILFFVLFFIITEMAFSQEEPVKAQPKKTTTPVAACEANITWLGTGNIKMKLDNLEYTFVQGETKKISGLKPDHGYEIKLLKPGKEYAYNDYLIFKKGFSSITININSQSQVIITLTEQKATFQSTMTSTNNTIINDISKNMVFVQGGTFTMGCTSEQGSDCSSSENPAHTVTVGDYYIGKTEITIEQYMAFVNETKSHYPEWLESESSYNINANGSDKEYYSSKGMSLSNTNYPITGVSWNDAVAFCEWLSKKTGKTYRLPTEAEWEYAARGGSKSNGYKYSGSNNIDDVAWYTSNSGFKTHPVGQKQANELGIYDMSGNVWEWCSDWYGSYSSGSQTNPKGASSGSSRVYRGGGWYYIAAYCRVAFRGSGTPDYRNSYMGFRIVSIP